MVNNSISYTSIIIIILILTVIYISYLLCDSSYLRVGNKRALFCKNPILYYGIILIGAIMLNYISKIKNKK